MRRLLKKYFLINGEFGFAIVILKLAVMLLSFYIALSIFVSIVLTADKLGILWIPVLLVYLSLIWAVKHLIMLRKAMQEFHASVGDEIYYKAYPSLLRRTLVAETMRSEKKPSWRNDKAYNVDYTYFRDNPTALKRELKREMRSALNSFTDYAKLDSMRKKAASNDK